MKIYHYDPATGEFLGEGEARIAPLCEGLPDSDARKWQIPAHATKIAPSPTAVAGEAAVFDGSVWSVVEDHRGEKVYADARSRPETIEALGPIAANRTTLPPPSEFHAWDGTQWVEDKAAAQAATAAKTRREQLKADAAGAEILAKLASATAAEIDAFIEAKVTNIASVKAMFKAVLKALAARQG